jgi:aspartyl-tRNA synthetase
LDTYGEVVVIQGIHIIRKKFDIVINGTEVAGGHCDGLHRARVHGAEEWSKFGSKLVINMNDITEEVVKSGGNVDLQWTLPPREL